MKTALRVIDAFQPTADRQQGADKAQLLRDSAPMVNRIFDQILIACPAYRPNDEELRRAKKVWMMALVDGGIRSDEELARGIRKLRLNDKPFLVSPGQFVAWCQPSPEDMGLPGVEDAYQEACRHAHDVHGADRRQVWSHPAVRAAGLAAGWFLLRSSEAKVGFPVYQRAYLKLVEQLRGGAVLDAPQLPSPDQVSHRPLTGDAARMRSQSLLRELRGF